jgi:hypothetical protein
VITHQQRIGFYREWSSRAARQALAAVQPQTKERCSHSAGIWARIADALEAGDDPQVARMTRNITFFNIGCLVPSV